MLLCYVSVLFLATAFLISIPRVNLMIISTFKVDENLLR